MIKTQSVFNWFHGKEVFEGDYNDPSGPVNETLWELHNKYPDLNILSINQSMNTTNDGATHVILYTIMYETGEEEEDRKTYLSGY